MKSMKDMKTYSDIFMSFMSFMLFMVEKQDHSFPMQFFAPLRLCVRKQLNEAWEVFPMPFSASPASLRWTPPFRLMTVLRWPPSTP